EREARVKQLIPSRFRLCAPGDADEDVRAPRHSPRLLGRPSVSVTASQLGSTDSAPLKNSSTTHFRPVFEEIALPDRHSTAQVFLNPKPDNGHHRNSPKPLFQRILKTK